jgi:hypothetical protein
MLLNVTEGLMEIQDGFIVGIFNYCDRWCETCRFTSRCRLFASQAEYEAAADPALKAVADAPPHPDDVRETPAWLAELIRECNEAAEAALAAPPTAEPLIAPLPPADANLSRRAEEYASRVMDWLQTREPASPVPLTDPRSTISWFCTMIASKTSRALSGLADRDFEDGEPRDCDGSAKVALIGIDRSITAWRDLVSVAAVTDHEATPYLDELHWLRGELLTRFPRAFSFVRPGFDEPDAVGRLEASGA